MQPQEEQDQEAAIGSSRRRRRSAKNQNPVEAGLLPKPTVSNEKSEKVQVVEKEAKKIIDENLHPVSKEPENEDIGKEKKENIDTTTTTPMFKGKKRTSRTSRTFQEEPPKDFSTAMVSQKSPKNEFIYFLMEIGHQAIINVFGNFSNRSGIEGTYRTMNLKKLVDLSYPRI